MGHLGQHGSCTGACAAAQSHHHDQQTLVVQQLPDVSAARLGSAATHFGIPTGAHPVAESYAQLHELNVTAGLGQPLIQRHDTHAHVVCAGAAETLQDVRTRAAESNDGNAVFRLFFGRKRKHGLIGEDQLPERPKTALKMRRKRPGLLSLLLSMQRWAYRTRPTAVQ